MAWYKQHEFAEKCGISQANLSVNKKRGNVIVSKEGLIDDSVAENREFLEKRLAKLLEKGNEVETKPHKEPAKTKENAKKELQNKPLTDVNGAAVSAVTRRGMLEEEKKEREIEKLEADIRLAQLREQKIRGEVIPVALIKQVFYGHSQSIITSMKESTESLLITISKEARLTGDQLAKLRGEMVRLINEAMDKAVKNSERSMKQIADEFSIKKDIGEHD